MAGLPSTRLEVPVACALVAAGLAAVVLAATIRPVGWDVTVLPQVDRTTGMGAAASRIDPGFRVTESPYDGQFFWGIAIDPIAAGDLHRSFDKPTYRYGHPLLGWLGFAASAGQARFAAPALVALGIALLGLAAGAAGALGAALGRSGWDGLWVALNPGLLYAAVHALGEPLDAALLLLALNGYVRGRRALTLVPFALLPLAKEELVLVPLGFAAWELVRARHPRRALAFAATVLPAAGWWLYARLTLGAWFTTGSTALGWPFRGWERAVLDAGVHGAEGLGEETIVVFAALLGLLAVAGLAALRLRGPLEPVYLALAAVAVCLAANATTIPRDALRNTALLLALVPFVTASPPLRPTWPERLAAGSSTGTARSPR